MDTTPDNSKLRWWQFKRRWFRLCLRAFLVLMTVGCIWLGWLVHRANQQRHAVQWVMELNGSLVRYDFELNSKGQSIRDGEPPKPEWLRNLVGIDYFANVVMVFLHSTQVSDVTPLANLTKLRLLDLNDTQVGDVAPLANPNNSRMFVPQQHASPRCDSVGQLDKSRRVASRQHENQRRNAARQADEPKSVDPREHASQQRGLRDAPKVVTVATVADHI